MSRASRKLKHALRSVAQRDQLIVQLVASQRRVQHLYEMSALLAHFQTVELTMPDVIALLAATLPLRSALFLEPAGTLRVLAWKAQGARAHVLREAKEHAREVYRYLAPNVISFDADEGRTLVLPSPSATESAVVPPASKHYVMLPFVSRGVIFGALQVEGAGSMSELDLAFINAVVNQVGSALSRDSADRALRDSEAKLAGILAIASDAVISVDEHHTIVMYNEGAEKVFGWTRAEALGQPLDILLGERFRARHREHIGTFAQGNATARKMGARAPIIEGRRKNGAEFPAEAAISRLKVGGAWLFTVMLRDITEQRRSEREDMFLSEASALFASTLDSETALGHIKDMVLREFGGLCMIELADDLGRVPRVVVAASDPAKTGLVDALKQSMLDRAPPHRTSLIVGSQRPELIEDATPEVLAAMTPGAADRRLLDGLQLSSLMGAPFEVGDRVLGALMVASCQPERRYGEVDLRFFTEVARRAALALDSARLYGEAQRAVHARDDVQAIVAHDLRTPLGSILLQVDMLRRRGSEPGRLSKSADVITRAIRRMQRLIQDLLDVASMEAGHLAISPEWVDPAELLRELVEAQQSLASSRMLVLRLALASELPSVLIDRDRLAQVVENLVGNSVKFTQSGGTITVSARVVDATVVFWVADTGMGVAAEHLPHLFDRFWQVDKGERRGSGLGLPIVKGIIEAHGGGVWAESTLGKGTTISFALPALPVRSARGSPAGRSDAT